jgi:hypothetical protein
MPRETIHHGREFAIVTVPAAKDREEYWYEDDAARARLAIDEGKLDAANVVFDNKPQLDVLWSRPIDLLSLPIGEEPRGSVQIQVSLTDAEAQRRLDHVMKHPEDLGEMLAVTFTESLTRYELNQMIKVLKRARDAAYGSDE